MKYKVSVALDIGLGLIDKKQVANNSTINSLGISNTQKSFGTISYNNIGISNSIIDYSNPQAAAQRNNKNLFVQNYYQTPSFSTPLESKRTNNNNETYINYNNLFKLTTKASLKFNYFGTFDRLRFNQNIDSKFFTTNDSFSQFNNSSNKLDLGNNLASIYFRNNKSKTTLIEATVNGNISNQSNIINGDNNFLGINSIDFIRKNKFIKFNIIYSHRINKNTAVKTEAVLSSNNPDVSVNFSPAFLNRISLSDNMASFLSSKKYLSLANTFFIKYKEFKIEASIAFSNLSLNYRNQLQGKSAIDYITLGKEFGNYTQRQFLQKLSIEKKIKKTTLRFNNNLIVLKQSDSKSIIYNYHHAFYAEPSVNITYKINNKNSFNTSYSRQQKPLYESFLLKNGLLQYNRVFEVNTVNFDFSKVNTLSLNYSLINLYNHFNLSIGGVLENTLGNIVNQVNLNDSIVKFSNEYTILKTNSKIAYFTSKKYLPSIKTTFKFSYNYSSANYYNSISNNNLRENIMYSNQVEFFIKTAFKGFFNFENTTIYNTNTVLPEKSKSNKQYFASFQNTASLLIKPSKYIFATLNNDYFIPNVGKTQKQKAISFIDFSLNFKPKKNKTDYRFIIRNVLNQKQATFIERTDFLFRQQSFSLLPRTIVFNVAFRL